MVVEDISDTSYVSIIDSIPYDEIYYLASIASPALYRLYPIETIRANVQGLTRALDLARKYDIKIFYASTSEVYGHSETIPFKEDNCGQVNTISDRAVYDESKRLGETLCATYNRLYWVDVRIGRIFNVFGPGMLANDGRAIPNLVNQAINNENISIYGDGEQTRSFCYVRDIVNAIEALMNVDYCLPVNIGDNRNYYTINKLWTLIQQYFPNYSGEVVYCPSITMNDPTVRIPDLSKIKSLSGWHPTYDFDNSLKATIDYFKAQYETHRHIIA